MKHCAIVCRVLLVLCVGSVVGWGQVGGPSISVTYIRGVVVDAGTHQPIANLRVVLELARYGYIDEASTDVSGKFEFRRLNHAVYVVRVQSANYRGTAQNTNSCDPAGCKRVDLSAASMEYITFSLQPLPSREAPALPGPGTVSAAELRIPENARKEFDKGKELAGAGQFDDSVTHFKKAIELFPDYPQAYHLMGVAYLSRGDFKNGENSLIKATELDARDGGAFLALGTAYAQEKDFVRAEKALVRGLELEPDTAEGHCQLSLAYWGMKRISDSDLHAHRCAQLKADYPEAHLLLGNLALVGKDARAALREYRQYLQLDPQGQYAPAAREQASRLEKTLGPQAD